MVPYIWVAITLTGCFTAWRGYLLLRLKQRHKRLRLSVWEAHQQLFEQDKSHPNSQSTREGTEGRLRSYLQLLDTLINTIPNPIFFKDSQGVFKGCNNYFAKEILGLTRDRIIGERLKDLNEQLPLEFTAAFQQEERKMTYKADIHTFEKRVRCADGKQRDFLFCLAPVSDENGSGTGSVAVLVDLTSKNNAHMDRMRKEKLESVLETAGAVCHELNQPLQALSGYTELIALQPCEKERQPYIHKILSQVDRMRDITRKLQGITQYETTDYAGVTKIIDIYKASAQG